MIRYGIQGPEYTIAFKVSKELHDTITRCCSKLEMDRSAFLRKAVRECIGLYELEERHPGTVLEPHQV